MRRLLVLCTLLASCAECEFTEAPPIRRRTVSPVVAEFYVAGGMDRFHDQELHVTCWRLGGETLSCLPDVIIGRDAGAP